jgi:hypothetical protein
VEPDDLGDARLHITGVDDIRHKLVSRHASAVYTNGYTN